MVPLRVLIAGSSPDNADLIVGCLRRHGYEVIYERADLLGILDAVIDQAAWDVTIADGSRAGVDALDALRQVKQKTPLLPLIVISSVMDQKSVVEVMRSGARDVVDVGQLDGLGTAVARELEHQARSVKSGQANEERYRRLAENAQDLIYRYRLLPERGFEYVSPSATAMIGYTPEDHYADPDLGFKLVHPDDRELLSRIAAGDELHHPVVLRWVRKDGTILWTEQRNVPVYDNDGKLVAIEGIARDITGRKQVEESLRRRTQEIDLLYQAGKQLGRTLDLETIYETVYEMVAQMMDCDGLFISSYSPDDRLIRCVFARHEGVLLDVSEFPPIPLQPEGQGTQSIAIRTGESLILNDYPTYLKTSQVVYHVSKQGIVDQEAVSEEEGITRSALIVPLKHEDQVTGVLQVFSYRYNAYAEDNLRALEALSPQISIATANALLYRQAQQQISERRQTEEALQSSHQFLRSILDALAAHIAILDENGTVIAVNEAWRRFGADNGLPDRAGEVGADYLAVCEAAPVESDPEGMIMAAGIRAVIAGQRSEFYLEYPCHSPQEKRWFMVHLNRFEIEGAVRVIVAHYDITERVLAEIAGHEQRALAEALRDTTAALSSTLDVDAVMNRILDSVGSVVPHDAANIMLIEGGATRMVAWHGYLPEQDVFFEQHHLPLDTPGFDQMLKTGMPLLISDTALSPDWVKLSETEWVRSYAAVPIRAHGLVIGFLNLDSGLPGFFTQTHLDRLQAFADQAAVALENAQLYDESRRYAQELERRVEQRTTELRRSKERVEAILNNSSDPVILTHADGAVQQTNSAFDALFQYQSDEVFGQPVTALVDPVCVEALREALNAVSEEGQVGRIELVARRKDGSSFDVEVGISVITKESGQPEAIICTLRDITERKSAERTLREALQTERELNDLKTRFVTMASHEFRTPLAIIQSSSDSLKLYRHRMDEDQINERLDNIETQVMRVAQLLDQVLTIGRSQANKIEFKPVSVDLDQFCRELVDEMQHMPGVTHQIIYSSACADCCNDVLADEKLLRQIISNLMTNAMQYSDSDQPVQFELLCHNREQATLRVEDHGIGISEDDQRHLFEPFHRGTNVGTIAGSGLGLAITKHAVDLYGGTITCDSRLGVGTIFTVTLPLVQNGAQ